MSSKTIMVGGVCLLLCLGFFVIGYALGNSKPWHWDIERRLQRTRGDIASDITQHRNPDVPYPVSKLQQIKRGNILAVLSYQSPLSLRSPSICEAIFYPNSDSKHALLVVHWIEHYPTPDTIRVVLTDGTTRDLPIFADDIEENRKTAKNYVLYNATIAFPHGSAGEQEMIANPGASAVLVQAGSETSARMPVALLDGTRQDEEEAESASDNESKP